MEHAPEGVITAKEAFIQREGMTLSYAVMTPHVSKAVVLIVHGINDHKGRYTLLQEDLAEGGYTSFAFDQRGFGLSGGKRVDVARYQDYHDDLLAVLALIRAKCPDEQIFLLGHSLGGLISATFCIDHPGAVDALVLSSPAFDVPSLPFHLDLLGYLLYFLAPTVSIRYPSPRKKRSHDPAVVNAVAKDPLIVVKATPRFYIQFKKMKAYFQKHADQIDLPTLILQAGDDVIVSPEGAKTLYERLKNQKKKLLWYDGFYHEVFHEIARTKVVADLLKWLNEKCADRAEARTESKLSQGSK